MTGLYLLLWVSVLSAELGPLWRSGRKRALLAAVGGASAAMGLWLAYSFGPWRLAEWLLGGGVYAKG